METIDKLSLSTSVFGKETEEHDLLEMLDITAEAGFEYVEISRKQYAVALIDGGLGLDGRVVRERHCIH